MIVGGDRGRDIVIGGAGNDSCVNGETVFNCELDALGALTGPVGP